MDKIRVYIHGSLGEAYEVEGFSVVCSIEDADVVVVLRGAEDGEFGGKVVVRQGQWSVGHTLRVARGKCEEMGR